MIKNVWGALWLSSVHLRLFANQEHGVCKNEILYSSYSRITLPILNHVKYILVYLDETFYTEPFF